jgi:hypothetical protein
MANPIKHDALAILGKKRSVTEPNNLYTLLDAVVSAIFECGISESDIKETLEAVFLNRAAARGKRKLTIDKQIDLIEKDWPGFRSFVSTYTGDGVIRGVLFRTRICVRLPHGPAIYEDLYDDGKFRFMSMSGTNRQFRNLIEAVDYVEKETGRVL